MNVYRKKSPYSDEALLAAFCPQTVEKQYKQRGYLYRCSREPGHTGDHNLRSTPRLLIEAGSGLPLSSRLCLVPRNGDWHDMNYDNWEVTTKAELGRRWHRSEEGREQRKHKLIDEVWCKECEDCGQLLPEDRFEKRRNLCRECWLATLRRNSKARENHVKEFGCVLINGKHYHTKTSEKDFWHVAGYRWVVRNKKELPPKKFERAVLEMKKRLQAAMTT